MSSDLAFCSCFEGHLWGGGCLTEWLSRDKDIWTPLLRCNLWPSQLIPPAPCVSPGPALPGTMDRAPCVLGGLEESLDLLLLLIRDSHSHYINGSLKTSKQNHYFRWGVCWALCSPPQKWAPLFLRHFQIQALRRQLFAYGYASVCPAQHHAHVTHVPLSCWLSQCPSSVTSHSHWWVTDCDFRGPETCSEVCLEFGPHASELGPVCHLPRVLLYFQPRLILWLCFLSGSCQLNHDVACFPVPRL